ncbi:hypothetical protein GGX14DRAFT_541080 [Mycena pura]|uniref:DUF6534 domain-containing protein n=1 Tax=Mycena pura TaxID=153505 RepID=A0AAD6VR32_9AGAR|nr:hypothetical protein GGX14DRAFT_541080 [Mycena pura]
MSVIDLNPTFGSLLIGSFKLGGTLTKSVPAFKECSLFKRTHTTIASPMTPGDLRLYWGGITSGALVGQIHTFLSHLLFVSAATILCQGFFLHRVYIFSRKNWMLAGVLALAAITSLSLSIWTTISLGLDNNAADFDSIERRTIPMFAVAAAVDLVIAILLVYYLQKGKTSLKFVFFLGVRLADCDFRTKFVVTKIIQYTVSTSLATSLLALASAAACAINPKSFAYIGMQFSVGRIQTSALLATLNARRKLRSHLNDKSSAEVQAGGNMNEPVFAIGQTVTTITMTTEEGTPIE